MRGLTYYLILLFLSYASKGCQTRRIYLCISDTIFDVFCEIVDYNKTRARITEKDTHLVYNI